MFGFAERVQVPTENSDKKNKNHFFRSGFFGADVHNTSSSPAVHILSFVLYYISSDTEEYIMSNIIEDLYYGNIEPQEVNSEIAPKLKKSLSELAEKEEQLTARLNGEDKELFQNYVSSYIQFSTVSNADSFISGFRFGANFIYDTFVKDTKG